MTRTFYFLVPLAAIGLFLAAQTIGQARPEYAPSSNAPAPAAEAAAMPDPAATAVDDLAAWPVAASR